MAAGDGDLVERVLGGDDHAYEALVSRHYRRAHAVARSVLGDDPAADDVVQEAFLRGYRRLGQLSDGSSFPSWIATIARNQAIGWIRKHRRHNHVAMDEQLPDAAPSRMEEAEEAAERAERGARLRAALEKLRRNYREILHLKYEAGLSYDELADTLGTSVANVEKRLYRARQALQKQMEG